MDTTRVRHPPARVWDHRVVTLEASASGPQAATGAGDPAPDATSTDAAGAGAPAPDATSTNATSTDATSTDATSTDATIVIEHERIPKRVRRPLDLARFVSELGKPGPYAIRSTPTIQRWQVLENPPTDLATANADTPANCAPV